MPLCLKPPSAKPSLIAAQVFVQTVPAWISRLTWRLMLMLVKMPAARPYSVALARAMASVSVSKTSKVATGPKTSFWTISALASFDLEQGRPVEGSGGEGAVGRGAAAHDRLGVGERGLDYAVDSGDVSFVDERAHVGAGVEPVTDAHGFEQGRQPGADLVGHPPLHQDPRAGHAEFPCEGGDPRRQQRDGAVEVGVIEHDHGRLAAKLKVHPLEGGGAVRGDQAPDCGAAGVADDLDVR
jgi:hypothetical protein